MDLTRIIAGLLLIVLVVVGGSMLQVKLNHAMLRKWAAKNGYTIIESEYGDSSGRSGPFRTGPFTTLFHSRGSDDGVYRVVVQEQAGTTRKGWVRLSSVPDQTDVRWDLE